MGDWGLDLIVEFARNLNKCRYRKASNPGMPFDICFSIVILIEQIVRVEHICQGIAESHF